MFNTKLPLQRLLWGSGLVFALGIFSSGWAQTADDDLTAWRSALIPKREVGADQFMAENPTYDGRGVIIAVFDTGVDPAAPGLAVTTTGERKVIDIIDGSGSGDVDTSMVISPDEDGTLAGLTGLKLILPEGVSNPSGEFRVGMKPAAELFPTEVLARLQAQVETEWEAELALIKHRAERANPAALDEARALAPADRSREQQNLVALEDALTALDAAYAGGGPGLVYDCVVWHDGETWQVIVDANRNGDLRDDPQLRPYGIAGEFGTFDSVTHASYGVQVYEDGKVLSIVTTSDSHGTHVASIAAAHFPEAPERNGVAPGARILSVKIGDTRVGSSSYGTGERRAVAMAARYGVDIANVSFGGSSTYQDGTDHFSTAFKTMVARYDILTIMSAGNEGPGLSTAGTAGGEADWVLGVGAHASAEMSTALYNAIQQSPDAALQFSSRGPTKDGDIGVDIMGPGAAWASYSADTLSAASMNNGTSMSAPSVTGVAALVLSAAQQNGLDPRPARLRHALMSGAKPIEEEAVFTTGAGMAHAPGAWANLQQLATEAVFDVFWDREVSGGTFVDTGRGLYLRESVEELRRQTRVRVTPVWPESIGNEDRYRFEADLVLQPADPWVEAPALLHVANTTSYFNVQMTLPAKSEQDRQRGSVITSRVEALLAGQEDLGAVFSLPITVVRPADPAVFNEGVLRTSLTLNPAVTARRFYEVPPGMEKLQIKVKHVAADPLARRFFLQVITPAAQRGQNAYKNEVVAWLEEGEERLVKVDVRPGGVTELAFNQYFYSAGESTLELELTWLGVGLVPNPVVMPPGIGFTPVELMPTADREVGVSAELNFGVTTHLPTKTSDFFGDERSERPPSPRQPHPEQDRHLRLEYEVSFEKPASAALGFSALHDLSEAYTGGRVKVVHESGAVLYNGLPDPEEPIAFPKGKSTLMGEWSTSLDVNLNALKTLPVRLMYPLDPVKTVPVYAEERAVLHGQATPTLSLYGDRQEIIFLANTLADDLGEVSPKPEYLTGSLTFTDEANREIVETDLLYLIGPAPGKVTDQEPEAKPADELKTDAEKLADAVYDLNLAFVQEHRLSDEAETVERRQAVLQTMMSERPDDAAPYLEKAIEGAILAGLASDFWGKLPEDLESDVRPSEELADSPSAEEKDNAPKVERVTQVAPTEAEILAWLDEAEQRSDSTGVAQFFGAQPGAPPGDLTARDALAAAEKRWTRHREHLATIARLRADIHRGAGRMAAAWAHVAELGRWEPEPAPDTAKLMTALYLSAELPGLALASLNQQIEEDPHEPALLKQRIALYRQLGWIRHAEAEERRLAVQAGNLARIHLL